jgi:hypothetical protein
MPNNSLICGNLFIIVKADYELKIVVPTELQKQSGYFYQRFHDLVGLTKRVLWKTVICLFYNTNEFYRRYKLILVPTRELY